MDKDKPHSASQTEYAWLQIFDEHPEIELAAKECGKAVLAANEIKKYREPRLMTKHDASEMVPRPLREKGLNVLPISRVEYIVGGFKLFEPFPDMKDVTPKEKALPSFETLKINEISSESNAINALVVSGILSDFLEEEHLVETFNGRMGSGDFSFCVNLLQGGSTTVDVRGAQIEIDGGFETEDSIVIMEAKNVLHDDFQIRQLYYPLRKFAQSTRKPIRLVFSQYTNLEFHLFEYEFPVLENLSSIRLKRKAAYTLGKPRVNINDVLTLWEKTEVAFDDDMLTAQVPFIQADRFDRIISLMEHLGTVDDGLTTEEIALLMEVTTRQAGYYPAAGEYLGLFDRSKRGTTRLTQLSKEILKKDISGRRLALIKQMFRHEIFHTLFGQTCKEGKIPSNEEIMSLMKELNVCNPGKENSMFKRRSGSVKSWLEWIISVIEL